MKQLLFVFVFLPMMVFSQSNFEKAEKLYEERKWDQSEAIFKKIAQSEPTNTKVLEYLGDIAGHQKAWDDALGYYGKLKKAKPSEADYHFKYGGA